MNWKTGTIAQYYPMALTEGEGLGTAYEYTAKERKLAGLLEKLTQGSRILIAGIPEKYGYSLDFCNLAMRIGAHLTIADDRPERLDMGRKLAERMFGAEAVADIDYVGIRSFQKIVDPSVGSFDLVLSCEVIQRLNRQDRLDFIEGIVSISDNAVIFAPNGDNSGHANRSGLNALGLDYLIELAAPLSTIEKSGYTDMPPFPPGIKRNEQQREQVLSSKSLGVFVDILNLWCRMEAFLPPFVKKRFCNIAYVMLRGTRQR